MYVSRTFNTVRFDYILFRFKSGSVIIREIWIVSELWYVLIAWIVHSCFSKRLLDWLSLFRVLNAANKFFAYDALEVNIDKVLWWD